MQFYNTLTRQLAPFKPINEGVVSLYTCGPTVYDFAHIGNLRAFIFDDTLRRTLEAAGYRVNHAMNITDVGHLVSDGDEGEDKLEKGSRREGKTAREVADHYTEVFKSDMAALNVLPPNAYHDKAYDDTYVRATQFVPAQIEMVERLIERGHAYIAKRAIYFDVTSISDYGRLSGQSLEEKEVGVRSEVVVDDDKRHPHDFAVWFFTVGAFKDHSMHWPTPWGDGFPGWHLECSAIIHAVLGDPIDIHTGGVDHIGTHHPNEIAQTEGAYGHPLAHTWIHNEFVMVDGRKMAKSAGTGYTVTDLKQHGFDPLVFRLLVLQAHYRSELNFSWESMTAARSALETIYAWSDLALQPSHLSQTDNPLVDSLLVAISEEVEDDLNTPRALALIYELIDQQISRSQHERVSKRLELLFGLGLTNRPDIDETMTGLLRRRQTARETKDWATSDALREEASRLGVEIEDTPNGQRWRRRLT